MIATEKRESTDADVRFPGIPEAMDGTAAVVAMETAASEAAGAYPITPSTQMGEGWAVAAAQGNLNVNGRRLLFFEPEGEHAAAAVTAGMSMMGLRSANFSSGQGIAYMHESLYAAVGKRLTYVLNMACRAMTKHALNVHAGHDDYHAIDDTGFFQLFAKDAQEAADLNLICHRIAELSLNPGVCAQDGFLTSHVIESILLPERDLVREYLGDPADMIETPTPAQRLIFGEKRRRIPEIFDVDNPTMVGVVQNQESYAQGVAAQRPFFFAHIEELTERAMAEYAKLTGRRYHRASGYLSDDAEVVLVGQGSVVANAEAVADYLRRERGLKIGVLNVSMFRPFPADLVAELLVGKRSAIVLERLDQPLAVDGPLLREIRAAMSKAVENHRTGESLPAHPGIPACTPDDVPDFYSGCFGLGSRDLQPGDLISAVENVLDGGSKRRLFYLGIEFVRPSEGDTIRSSSPQLGSWQDRIKSAYPKIEELSLEPAKNVNLLPEGSLAVRIHSVGGWGAMTMGKNLTMTLFNLLGMSVKSNPKYGSEKKGQPTTFYSVFAHDPIRTNCELKHVDVVLSPDPNVFRHSNPLAGLAEGGTFIVQHDGSAEELWQALPTWTQKLVRQKKYRVFHLDAFAIARAETDSPDLQFRMQGAAFQGAFFKGSPIMAQEKMDENSLFEAIHHQLEKKFGHRGPKVVEDNVRVIRRGYDEVLELDWASLPDTEPKKVAPKAWEPPWYWTKDDATDDGVGDTMRFAGQVCQVYAEGEDPLADPFAALSVVPAATSVMRDMTDIRFEVPEFLADRCTGCGQCWTQCPDAAIPGLVSEVEDILRAGIDTATEGRPSAALRGLVPSLVKASEALVAKEDYRSFAGVLTRAYADTPPPADLDAGARAELDRDIDAVVQVMEDFPVAKTAPFYALPERREEGSGGLLSVTINPYACKGCNLCVEVCPDRALVAVKQDEATVEKLRRNWSLWQKLPDTPERFIQVSDIDEGIGVLHTLMLKKDNFHSMLGGDGSCMGCGEKTGVHLIVSAIEAAMHPRVEKFVVKLDGLVEKLEHKAAELVMVSADLDHIADAGAAHVDVEVSDENRARLGRISRSLKALKDLRWRYVAGPSQRGRASLGITNSTGCSSVWGSTYPYNPYPYPWTNHLFQDAPSIAIGIFEGQMRKMADGFAAVRQAELELADAYDPAIHDRFFEAFGWLAFDDDEFKLCPPILTIGGDGAMLDIGFQNVSRLMASGKPIRVLVLDTQVYSNTGGQACTSGYHGQVSDMAAYGEAKHGKEEQRKEMALIAMAHRGAYVLQSSQALPSHFLGGVLRGLNSRRPAIFNIYSPCQAEHGLPDSGSANAAKLALESRAFPYLVYDPDRGTSFAERLDLDGNPDIEETWPKYQLEYTTDDGKEETMELPLTVADWAATEPRFGRHFKHPKPDQWTDDMVVFHEFFELSNAERQGKQPFIYIREKDGHLGRLLVSREMVELAEERLDFWNELRELAGLKVSERVKKSLTGPLARDYESKLGALKEEYEAKLADLKANYPAQITRKIAEALVGGGLADMLPTGPVPAVAAPVASSAPASVPASVPRPAPTLAPKEEPVAEAAPAPAEDAEPEDDEAEGMEPYIDTELCTTCNECTNLNPKMFAYNEDKKAYIKDSHAGTYAQIVQAAERCTAGIIHPGDPLDPDEPDLEKWQKRAERFNV